MGDDTARLHRGRNEKEAWRQAVREMTEGLQKPLEMKEELVWGTAVGLTEVWWSADNAKKKGSLVDRFNLADE